jgi:signal transduction histidine kinase
MFIVLVSYTISRKVARETVRDFELGRLKSIVELAGAAAHEIRQPLTVLITVFATLRRKYAADDNLVKNLDGMTVQCERIDRIIEKMNSLTNYQTKTYVGNLKIVDLDNVSKKS